MLRQCRLVGLSHIASSLFCKLIGLFLCEIFLINLLYALRLNTELLELHTCGEGVFDVTFVTCFGLLMLRHSDLIVVQCMYEP